MPASTPSCPTPMSTRRKYRRWCRTRCSRVRRKIARSHRHLHRRQGCHSRARHAGGREEGAVQAVRAFDLRRSRRLVHDGRAMVACVERLLKEQISAISKVRKSSSSAQQAWLASHQAVIARRRRQRDACRLRRCRARRARGRRNQEALRHIGESSRCEYTGQNPYAPATKRDRALRGACRRADPFQVGRASSRQSSDRSGRECRAATPVSAGSMRKSERRADRRHGSARHRRLRDRQ